MNNVGDEVVIGTELLAAGRVTRSELARCYVPVFRGVYRPRHIEPTLRHRTIAAWLATDRRGVIAGAAASALHGARWVDPDTVIEVLDESRRPQCGLLVRHERLAADEVTHVAGLPVTTPERTAFDLGRRAPRATALARLDAVERAVHLDCSRVEAVAARYRGARGLKQLRALLPLVDGGADSPRESVLRLLLLDAGFPAPRTQLPVVHGHRTVARLDMGWESAMIAVEYDGDQHRTDRRQYRWDVHRHELLTRCGWIVIRVLAEDSPAAITARVRDAFRRREIDLSRHCARVSAA